jgi:phage terminase small subunit
MTIKQKKFVENILKGENGINAVKKAGYGKKNKPLNNDTAKAIASENLTKPHIKAEINKGMARIEKKTDITIKEIINNARYLVKLGIEKKNGADIAAGNKQLGEMIAAFKQVQQIQQVKPQVVLFKRL